VGAGGCRELRAVRSPPDEREQLEAAAERAADAIEMAIADGIEAAMQQFNRRTAWYNSCA
jgi:peptidyl-tRNA hydrolase